MLLATQLQILQTRWKKAQMMMWIPEIVCLPNSWIERNTILLSDRTKTRQYSLLVSLQAAMSLCLCLPFWYISFLYFSHSTFTSWHFVLVGDCTTLIRPKQSVGIYNIWVWSQMQGLIATLCHMHQLTFLRWLFHLFFCSFSDFPSSQDTDVLY